MHIWVDADACPRAIKDLLFRAAEGRGVKVILVANKPLQTPSNPKITALQVPQGLDVADRKILQELSPGDLVVTADIPLAAEVIARGGHAIDPRGDFHTEDNIRERLSIRNFMDELRSSGVETGGPASFRPKDRQVFANQLDRFLTRYGSS